MFGPGACNWKRKRASRQAIEVSINEIERREGAWGLIIGARGGAYIRGVTVGFMFLLTGRKASNCYKFISLWGGGGSYKRQFTVCTYYACLSRLHLVKPYLL